MDQLKVAIIGAASPQWGYILSRDFIVKLSDEAICSCCAPMLVLEDIDERNLALQAQLARKVAGLTGNRVAVESTTDQKKGNTAKVTPLRWPRERAIACGVC
jgi:alpha-galactosidase/6-phospho-beta-glucosidase family protein